MEYPTMLPGLSNEQITEFQSLYLEQFGVQLSEEEAVQRGLALVGLVKAVTLDINVETNDV